LRISKKCSTFAAENVRIVKKNILVILFLVFVQGVWAYNMRSLGDSLDAWAGFNLGCIPKVKVTQIRSTDNTFYIYTNKVLSCLSLSPQQVSELRRKTCEWLTNDTACVINIFTDGFEIGELVTERFRPRTHSEHYPIPNKGQLGRSLGGQTIALWPSHGVYYNRDEDRWKLQRATMWSTVEDLYTTVYAEEVSRAMERAGATVVWPRARYGKDSAAVEIGPSGYPRWAEGARYWLEYIGISDSIWQPITDKNNPAKDSVRNDYLDDLRCRGLWVNWLTKKTPVTVCLALHTDGYSEVGDSLTIGTLAIYSRQDKFNHTVFPNGADRMLNRDLADYVQTQIVADIQHKYDPNWKRRQLQNASYCEARYPVVPTLLLEILSHKQFADIRWGLQPAFRKDVSRAIYKGVGRWIHAQTGTTFVVQPLPVQDMKVTLHNNEFKVTWKETKDPLEDSAKPEYYVVELRENDGEWQSGVRVKSTQYTIHAKRGVKYDIRVTAGNDGGTSEVSETLSAGLGNANKPLALIINAFNLTDGPAWFADSVNAGIQAFSTAIPDGEDGIYIGEQWEFNRALDWVTDDDCGWGMCYRDQTGTRQVGNTHDYAVQHGRALQQLGYSFVSTNITAIDSVSSRYGLVDLIIGRDDPIAIHLLDSLPVPCIISGAGIGAVPHATRTGVIRMGNKTFRLAITPNGDRLNCPNPTGHQLTKHDGKVVARYADSGVPACIKEENRILWSLPLEACDDFETLFIQSIKELTR